MLDYDIKDFQIVRFFSYTSTIPGNDCILVIDPNWCNHFPNLCDKFDCFYQDLRDKATELVKDTIGKDLYFRFGDNKTVFQIRHKFSGKEYFIGKYDSRRAIGNSCYMYDGSTIFDFSKMKESDYMSDVKANWSGLWKKFDF